MLLDPANNLAKDFRTGAAKTGSTRSSQATQTVLLRAINVPLRGASKGHSRPLVAAKPARNQAQTA
jgi:hypothetical protein